MLIFVMAVYPNNVTKLIDIYQIDENGDIKVVSVSKIGRIHIVKTQERPFLRFLQSLEKYLKPLLFFAGALKIFWDDYISPFLR